MGFIDLPRDIRYSSDLKSEEGGSETRYSANIALLPTHEHPPKLSNSFFLNIPRGIYVHLALCIFNALLVLILLVIFQGGLNDRERDLTCTKRLNQPSPASEAVEYEIQQFKGGLTARSIWSGNPGAEVDEAWHSITETGYFGLPEEVWKGLNPHSEEAVRLSNGQYLATLDVFHKLHCVDLLRRAVHFKYYHDKYPAFQNLSDATITAHLVGWSQCSDRHEFVASVLGLGKMGVSCNRAKGWDTHEAVDLVEYFKETADAAIAQVPPIVAGGLVQGLDASCVNGNEANFNSVREIAVA
ncbi:hypothetical protein V500_00207 [Pseudogymnoascus sp. VKM F-4518 (FW-2643)]|nr:hypothetical protein V500_00207 [Pseudogymnoascus sp. VKM F-4518 (FW-2643)]